MSATYPASQIKRSRASKSQMEARRAALFKIVQAMKPMTVRQVFYQATVAGVIDKTEGGYSKVQIDLVTMRRDGELPYAWLADNTRWQRKPLTFTAIVSVELDAIPPDELRNLVRTCIEVHLPANQLRVLQAAEQSERDILLSWVQQDGPPRWAR
jgi:hypothetical protein